MSISLMADNHTKVKIESSLNQPEVHCHSCHSNNLKEDHTTGDFVCCNCGLVASGNIPTDEAEWRNFMEDDDVDKYVRATACDNSVLDDNLKLLPQKKTRAGKSVYSQSIYTKAEKRIISAHQSMLAIANEIHVSKPVVLESLDMYKEYSKLSNNYHGSELDTICAALMYICCRKQNCFRLMIELSIASRQSMRDITESFKHVVQTLHVNLPLPSDGEYIRRYCKLLEVPNSIIENSIKIMAAVKEMGLITQNTLALQPTVVLFTSLLFNCKPEVTLENVVILSGKRERIIKSLVYRYSELYKSKDSIIFSAFRKELADDSIDQKELFSFLDRLPPTL